ncbi:hypothetical protein RFI_40362 [Reticulomyxa filosa]|uniref:Uncharacterized protein n=1 Tax=Reticulomyxa filosa TaxID=46433 RepID=X6L788_RETFI|nr:hypothetical protein RFI_40362 [Reticulomyxa filosa]|eukprot:ETN97170.1 hypothetical protein RFI_40362 [Reticulomyxa filosa]
MLMLGNVERKFKHWIDLFDACEGSLEIINNGKITQFIEFILSSSGFDGTINHNSTKTKEKTIESKVSAEEILFLANRNAREKDFKVDRSEDIAKKLVEQCFYNLENKQLPLMMSQIINKCEELYTSYRLDMCFLATCWNTVKTRVERVTRSKFGFKSDYVWKGEEKPSAALDAFVESIAYRNTEREEEYYSYSSSSAPDDEDSNDDESKGIFYYLFPERWSENIIILCVKQVSSAGATHGENQAKKQKQSTVSDPLRPDSQLNQTEIPTRGRKQVKTQKFVLDPPSPGSSSDDDEKTEAKKQDTVVDMTACIIENEFNKRWFTASEFYSVFSKLYLDRVSSDCPKDLFTCERIMRTARHPNSKFKMFHRKKKTNGRVINVYYFYCFPIQQCQVCNTY